MTFRNILCKLGLHSYEFRTIEEEGMILDEYRCKNPSCSQHKWFVAESKSKPW